MRRLMVLLMAAITVCLAGCSRSEIQSRIDANYVIGTRTTATTTTTVTEPVRHVIISDGIFDEYGPRTFIRVSVEIFDGSEHDYMSFSREPVVETLSSTYGTVLSKYSKDDDGNVVMRYRTAGMWIPRDVWTTGFNNYGFSITDNGNDTITLTMTMADDTGYPGAEYVTAETRSVTVPVGWVTVNVIIQDKDFILE